MTPLMLWFAVAVLFFILWAFHSVVTWAIEAFQSKVTQDNVFPIEARRESDLERQRLEAAFRFGGRSL